MSNRERLPCGCTIEIVNDAFVMSPCSPTCQYYVYAMEESARQGKPVAKIVDPEVDPETARMFGIDHG